MKAAIPNPTNEEADVLANQCRALMSKTYDKLNKAWYLYTVQPIFLHLGHINEKTTRPVYFYFLQVQIHKIIWIQLCITQSLFFTRSE